MPELAYFQEQHIAAFLQAQDADGLSRLLQRERDLTTKCGRAILQRLSMPPKLDNVKSVTARMRALQQAHDAFGEAVEKPSAASAAEWDAFLAQWAQLPVLDMNVLCEYCAEAGREMRKRIRAGKDDPATVAQRVQAVCELGEVMPKAARTERKAALDFYQQGILDMRRLRTAMRETGMDPTVLDGAISALTKEKRLLRG